MRAAGLRARLVGQGPGHLTKTVGRTYKTDDAF